MPDQMDQKWIQWWQDTQQAYDQIRVFVLEMCAAKNIPPTAAAAAIGILHSELQVHSVYSLIITHAQKEEL